MTHPTGSFVDSAGTGCAFDVGVQRENATIVDTTFSNGTLLETVIA